MTLKNVYSIFIDLHKTIIKNSAFYMNVKNQEMQIDYRKYNQHNLNSIKKTQKKMKNESIL
jgi:hypothetical protein